MNSAISSAGVQPALKHFDDLPSSAHVDASVAEDRPFKERLFAFDMPSAGLDAGAFAPAAEFAAIVGARA